MSGDYETGFDHMQITGQTCVARWMIHRVGKVNRWCRDMCGEAAVTMIAGAALCERHRRLALEWHREQTRADIEAGRKNAEGEEHLAALKRRWKQEAAQRTTATSWAAAGPAIVYYVRRESDGLIKIGTSTNFTRRLGRLRSEHGPLRVLLTHRGDRKRETATHEHFGDLRVEGEWFRPGPELLALIIETRRRRINKMTLLPGTVPLEEIEALVERQGLSDVA